MMTSSDVFRPQQQQKHHQNVQHGTTRILGGTSTSIKHNRRHHIRRQTSHPISQRKLMNHRFLLCFGVVILTVYMVGLHQGLQIVRTIENDTSNKMWASFLDLVDHVHDDGGSIVDEGGGEKYGSGNYDNDLGTSQDDDGTGMNMKDMAVDPAESATEGDSKHEAKGDFALAGSNLAVLNAAKHLFAKMAIEPDQPQENAVDVLYTAPTALRLPKPIINVGFPKGGTSTIFSFFHCNGLKAQHWLCCDPQNHPAITERRHLMSKCMIENNVAGRPIFEDCGDYDVYAEINGPRNFVEYDRRTMLNDGTLLPLNQSIGKHQRLFFPQHHLLDKIHHQYPNATFILNQRPAHSWVSSVLKWKSNLEWEILNEFFHQKATRDVIFPPHHKDYNSSTLPPQTGHNIGALLLTVYNYHLQFIRDWVAQHPSHALVEVDITNESAGTILADSFGLKEDCWGHFNKNKKDIKKGGIRPKWGAGVNLKMGNQQYKTSKASVASMNKRFLLKRNKEN